jgi:MFS family permease
VAVYLPLSTLVFPAWFNFTRQSAGALGVFLGAQALGAILGGLVFAAAGPRVSRYRWFVATNLAATAGLAALAATEPGSALAVVLSFAVGLVGAGSLPIINTAYYSRTPEALLGWVNGTSFAMVLTALPFSSLAFGWLINATSPETAIAVVVTANAVMVATFALLPAMRLIDAPAGQGQDR